ncbi:hypothetical protein OG411_29840 [Streptomyces pseudogriseolus]|uniref:hypothetical protein n=1 Tax=Streptomyces pseudogriseolus TaxID=36817 RepID=UPI003251C6A2
MNQPETAVDRIPLTRSVHYAVRGMPEVPNQYGPGVLAPSEITITYRDATDSQLGRIHAYVAGRIWVDGKEQPLLPGGLYGQHYFDGLDGWPEWLAEEARLHDPAVSSAGQAPATNPIHCPLCLDRPFTGPVDARAHFTAEHPEQELEGEGPWPLLRQAPATNHTDLRDRIAQAIEDAPYRPETRRSLQLADAVLAVLPAPTDRAATLRGFVRQLTDRLSNCCEECDACAVIARDLADAELRRLADETPDTQTALFWDEANTITVNDGRIAIPLTKAINLAQSAPAGHLILQLSTAAALRTALVKALMDDHDTESDTDCCGAEPPADGSWGDCWCTLAPDHDGEHRCQPCTDRHGAPGWTDEPAAGARQDGDQT